MFEHLERAQMTFAIRIQRKSGIVDRYALANRSQRVLHNPARASVHVHIATRYERQFQSLPFLDQPGQLFLLLTIGEQLDGNPQTITEGFAYPVIFNVE